MKRWFTILLTFLCITLLTSCNADPEGLISANDVDQRFGDSVPLAEKTDLTISQPDFSFIVISDTHIYDGPNSNLAALPSKLAPEDRFILACGDLSQRGDKKDMESLNNYLNLTALPHYTAIGNHDIYYDGWHNYKQVFGKSCYSLTAGPLLIISLDSANGTLGKKQKNWLEGVLKAKTQPLCIVFTHFEFFNSQLENIQQYTDIEEVYFLMHLFETHGVNYVFAGHSHYDDYRRINGINYLTVADFSDEGGKKAFFRVKVNGMNMTHERVEIN